MKKYLAFISALLLLVAVLAGCGSNPDSSSAPAAQDQNQAHNHPAVDVNVTAISGPTGIGMVNLMQSQKDGKTINNYHFNVVSAPDQAVAAIVNGTADIAAVPTNLASALYKKTGGKVKVLAVNTLGVLSILSNGETITKVSDLKDKTIYTSGQGANPEYILKYVLERNGLVIGKDVKIEFVADNDTLATLMINGTAKVAMVPEPKATTVLMQNPTIQRVLNMTDEWQKKNDQFLPADEVEGTLMMGCVVARTDFITKNQHAVQDFLTEYESSINAVMGNKDTTATLCETYGIIPKAAIAKAAIPHCNITFVSGQLMKSELSAYLKVLNGYNPNAIGGELPKDDFYYVG